MEEEYAELNQRLDALQGSPEAYRVMQRFLGPVQRFVELNQRHPGLRVFLVITEILSSLWLVIGGPVMVGYKRFCLHLVDGQEAKAADLFSVFHFFGQTFWLRLRIGLQIFAWSLLFIVPGIVASYRYAMAPYIMAEDPTVSVSEAIRRSKEIMNGRKGDLFLLDLSFIGWALLAILTMGIGDLWLSPYANVARTCFYRNVSVG